MKIINTHKLCPEHRGVVSRNSIGRIDHLCFLHPNHRRCWLWMRLWFLWRSMWLWMLWRLWLWRLLWRLLWLRGLLRMRWLSLGRRNCEDVAAWFGSVLTDGAHVDLIFLEMLAFLLEKGKTSLVLCCSRTVSLLAYLIFIHSAAVHHLTHGHDISNWGVRKSFQLGHVVMSPICIQDEHCFHTKWV